MARETERDGPEGSSSGIPSQLSVVDSIRALAAKNARADLSDDKQLLLFLQSWWSRIYNRPLKDPVLLSYTLEELIYEFYDKVERNKAELERAHSENDKIEEDKEKAVLDWAEEEEKKELDALKSKASTQEKQPTLDPAKDPKNIAWMEEQIQKSKAIFGESFGEDIDEEFSE